MNSGIYNSKKIISFYDMGGSSKFSVSYFNINNNVVLLIKKGVFENSSENIFSSFAMVELLPRSDDIND